MKGKNAAYPKAIDELKVEKELPENLELRQNKHLNNRALAGPSVYQAINTHPAWDSTRSIQHGRSLRGYEAMNMIRKGIVVGVEKGDVLARTEYARSNFRSCCVSVS